MLERPDQFSSPLHFLFLVLLSFCLRPFSSNDGHLQEFRLTSSSFSTTNSSHPPRQVHVPVLILGEFDVLELLEEEGLRVPEGPDFPEPTHGEGKDLDVDLAEGGFCDGARSMERRQ